MIDVATVIGVAGAVSAAVIAFVMLEQAVQNYSRLHASHAALLERVRITEGRIEILEQFAHEPTADDVVFCAYEGGDS